MVPDLVDRTSWRLCRVRAESKDQEFSSSLLDDWADLEARERELGIEADGFFLLKPDGSPDRDVVAYFNSVSFRGLAHDSRSSYATDLKLYLSFLESQGLDWRHATAEDFTNYEYWRRRDPRNARRVSGAKFSRELAACGRFYSWQVRRGVVSSSPVERADVQNRSGDRSSRAVLQPRNVRSVKVKWLTPRAYRRWRDVGLGGYLADGTRQSNWRGRNDARNMAMADFLWATGLRLREGATPLLRELPIAAGQEKFVRGRLSSAVAKGSGREYWVSQAALRRIDSYRRTTRQDAVRRAQQNGRYNEIVGKLMLEGLTDNGELTVRDGSGNINKFWLDQLDASQRLKLFRETDAGLEPLQLWLTESGQPMPYLTWEAVFAAANRRCKGNDVDIRCHPHMLRHSFALRMLVTLFHVLDRRLGLTPEERREYRHIFGDPWVLVQTMLGHASLTTTRNHYLEPVQGLQVDMFLNGDVDDSSIDSLLSQVATQSPLVKDTMSS